ncbi:MAG: hypothetical protein R2714_15760 [Microthrixaceae bacterium]
MGLRRQCLEEVGLFDERFFSYCEEADLALRARSGLADRSRPWSVRDQPGSRLPGLDRRLPADRNTLLLVQEHSGWYHALVRICFTLVQIVRGTISPGTRPPVFDASARLAGIRDFFRRRFGPPPPR